MSDVCSRCNCHSLILPEEIERKVCFLCRRFDVLLEPKGTPNMIIKLTDAQITRVLELTSKIAAIRQELPIAPRGFDVNEEIAKNLRTSMERHNDWLVELGALLR